MKNLLVCVILTLPAVGETPVRVSAESAIVRLTADAPGLGLEVLDPGNHSWRLQSSDHLGTWTSHGTHRVFNGLLRIPVAREGTRRFDKGLGGVTGLTADEGFFKVP